MDSGMTWELAQYHIADLRREADQDRLAGQIRRPEGKGFIDVTSLRERIGRLLRGFAPHNAGGPRAAGT